MNKLLTVGSLIMLSIVATACNKAEDTAEVQHDVQKAQADRAENVAEARKDGAEIHQFATTGR